MQSNPGLKANPQIADLKEYSVLMMRCTILVVVLVTAVRSACFFDRELCDQKYGCSYGCYKVSFS